MVFNYFSSLLGGQFDVSGPEFALLITFNIISFCTGAFLSFGAPGEALAQAGDHTEYIVDGLALGGPVAPRSATYREYKCQPNEQF
jgi:hypothetical protein